MKTNELAAIITGIKTALPIGITQTTKDNGLYTKNNPYRDAVKQVTYAGMIGCRYENAVNNQLGREDKELDFFAKPHKWMDPAENNLGKKRSGGDERYLPFKVQATQNVCWMMDGIDVTDNVQQYRKPAPEAPKTQDALDTKIDWRTPSLESIKSIRMLGAEYTIES